MAAKREEKLKEENGIPNQSQQNMEDDLSMGTKPQDTMNMENGRQLEEDKLKQQGEFKRETESQKEEESLEFLIEHFLQQLGNENVQPPNIDVSKCSLGILLDLMEAYDDVELQKECEREIYRREEAYEKWKAKNTPPKDLHLQFRKLNIHFDTTAEEILFIMRHSITIIFSNDDIDLVSALSYDDYKVESDC